jgi:hypothetical protein
MNGVGYFDLKSKVTPITGTLGKYGESVTITSIKSGLGSLHGRFAF